MEIPLVKTVVEMVDQVEVNLAVAEVPSVMEQPIKVIMEEQGLLHLMLLEVAVAELVQSVKVLQVINNQVVMVVLEYHQQSQVHQSQEVAVEQAPMKMDLTVEAQVVLVEEAQVLQAEELQELLTQAVVAVEHTLVEVLVQVVMV